MALGARAVHPALQAIAVGGKSQGDGGGKVIDGVVGAVF